MNLLLSAMPQWLIISVIILFTMGILFVLIRGFKAKFRGTSIDTTSDRYIVPNISIDHILQFKRLKAEIEIDVSASSLEYQIMFIELLKDLLIAEGLTYHEACIHDDALKYESALKYVLLEEYFPNVCKTIFANHFPERGTKKGKAIDELPRDYNTRFLEDYSKPAVDNILMNTTFKLGKLWPCVIIKRGNFVLHYKIGTDFYNKIVDKFHGLLMSSMLKRDFAFDKIMVADGTSIKDLKFEWASIYG